MKSVLILLLISSFLFGCHKDQIEATPEVKATIVEFVLNPLVFCACCQGYRLQIEGKEYFTNHVPTAYQQPNTYVLIRYQQPEEGCTQAHNRIQIISIRGQ